MIGPAAPDSPLTRILNLSLLGHLPQVRDEEFPLLVHIGLQIGILLQFPVVSLLNLRI